VKSWVRAKHDSWGAANLSLNPSRYWLAIGNNLPSGSLVLDAGAGDQRNRVHFGHCTYESADFQKLNKRYTESTSSIPVEGARYDAVVFTQVMEHLPEPARVVDELFRVRKPGGRLFYSAPLVFHEHEVPYDFMRYTQFGVRSILERAGFRVPEVKRLEGYLGTVSYEFRRISKSLPFQPNAYGGGVAGFILACCFTSVRLVARPLAWIAARADRRHRWLESGYPINYFGVFEKLDA